MEYDSAKDAHDSYYAAVEAKRLRVEKAGKAANDAFRKFFPGSRMDKETREAVALAAIDAYNAPAPRLLFCSECDCYEHDPLFLDVERCSKCGELIEASDDD
jgi:hypothetical protein